MSTIESEKFAAAARTLADLEKEQEHQLAIIQVAEKEVEARRAVANEAQERANGAAELLADKESNLRSYRDGLSIIQQSISNVHTTLRLAHKRLFSDIDKEKDGTPDLSSDATSSSDHPGPCLSCGAIESSRFRRGGTQCNACYLRGEEDPTLSLFQLSHALPLPSLIIFPFFLCTNLPRSLASLVRAPSLRAEPRNRATFGGSAPSATPATSAGRMSVSDAKTARDLLQQGRKRLFLELEEDDADTAGSSTYSSAHEKGPCHTCGAKHFSRLRAGGML
ncbi:hypothetical protein A4X13_0g9010 [Tilletia indica]|uniref:Uncharacterized protein n=1 Tax=Tilletia indica TaxID=43049 RepID=A0A8T8SBV3_9BASI|nr:hypothetical protein A4X13_0g9010 [Tilletia indica]